MTLRVGVLASGGGTNLQAILDYLASRGNAAASVVLVATDKQNAGAISRAQSAGVQTEVFDASDDGSSLLALLRVHDVELLVLAGYMRKVPAQVVTQFHRRMINIHPGLLPKFGGPGMYGARVHDAVLASGERTTGVTVHFVDNEYDHGPVIAQWPIPVREDDTSESLAARVLEVEHIVYPRVVELVAALNSRDIFADF